jgi:hypothetical protein
MDLIFMATKDHFLDADPGIVRLREEFLSGEALDQADAEQDYKALAEEHEKSLIELAGRVGPIYDRLRNDLLEQQQ